MGLTLVSASAVVFAEEPELPVIPADLDAPLPVERLMPPAAAPPLDERPLVAVLLPTTGERREIGVRAARSMAIAVAEASGVRVEFFDVVAQGADAAYRDAVAAGAAAILGPIFEDEARAVIAASNAAGPPIFLLAGIDGLEGGPDHIYRLKSSPGDQARALAQFLTLEPENQTFAVLAPDDSYGSEASAAFVVEIRRKALESEAIATEAPMVVSVVQYETGNRDVSAEVAELAGNSVRRLEVPANPWRDPPSTRRSTGPSIRPQFVFIPDYAEQVASILPFFQFYGLVGKPEVDDVEIIGLSGWLGGPLEHVTDVAAGSRVAVVFHPKSSIPASGAFVEEFETRFGQTPTEFDGQIHDAASFLLSVVDQIALGSATPQNVRIAVEEIWEFGGACGTMWLNENGAVVRDIQLWEIDGFGSAFPVTVIQPETEEE